MRLTMLISRLSTSLLLMLAAITKSYADNTDCLCHPTPQDKLPQYIIGYGSLMETTSKNKTDNTSGENRPVMIDNYQRGWFATGLSVGLSTTYLGIVKQPNAHFNGTIFRLATPSMIKNYDKREKYYCRVAVPTSSIHTLDHHPLPNGQFWIYETKPEFMAKPSEKYPLIESYVDIFLSGCLEIEKKFHLKGFTAECIKTTTDWSPHWVNDRIYPRRPFVFEPNALTIDKALADKLPHIFNQIKPDGSP
ncbi:hypothetical protein [Rickettsiella endosymbiont of Dermanyssus gallinae]|uniref:hypothetical protein n=1 Tax=Rickettsiella endosymbiont of Dermanyssus gallinae TaxID=2856608 RepID=UPI001C53149C|nr:hypothetical protein [Rickettsiella endosymbiont of Dermanyssus gallinae]